MLMTKKIIILLLFVLSVLSVYSADDSILSTYRVHDPNIILSNASQCYKDGFYDISFDLCQAYLENEKIVRAFQ
jgi:hypothetical protein